MTECQSFGAGILFVLLLSSRTGCHLDPSGLSPRAFGIVISSERSESRDLKRKFNTIDMIRPLADRVVIEPKAAETQTASGLYIPETAKEKPQQGTVVAAGPGKKDEPMEVKVGDVVIYGKYSGTEVSVDGKDYLIMKQSDILAIL